MSPSSSASDLAARRRQLRQQRRQRRLKRVWQYVFLLGLIAGALWLFTRPRWIIATPAQVQIEGAQTLSADALREQLKLRYPSPLFRIDPQQVADQLSQFAPVTRVSVVRSLWPTKMIVHVQERQPVARAWLLKPSSGGRLEEVEGFIDAEGHWDSLDTYERLAKRLPQPSLEVLGLREQNRAEWPRIYRLLQSSPIVVKQLNWEDPSNLILETELGSIYLGAGAARLPQQLQVLDQLRNVKAAAGREAIAYIDLSNPDTPRLQMLPQRSTSAQNRRNGN
jgi:cell division protein FtsQ